MTERKPAGVSFESWVDRQVREAEERGAFKDLPGLGQPLPDETAPYDENWWVKKKLAQEQVSALPATLVLRKEAEDALAAARSAPTEAQARTILTEINEKIRAAMTKPLDGPPLNLVPFDIEDVLGERRRQQGTS